MASLSIEESPVRKRLSDETGKVKVETLQTKESTDSIHTPVFWRYLHRASKKLDSLGVETRGIERIEPYERSTNKMKQFLSVVGLWLSACGGLSSMSAFLLGPLIFELGLKKSLVSGMVGQAIGCAVAAYCSLMGPRSGCRQMVSARFLFGWWFVKLVSLVSIIGVMGWSIVNCVVGGQILQSVSDGKIPLVVGIIIVALISLCVAIGGIRQLMKVEVFLSIPVNLAFLLLYVAASQKFHLLSNLDGEDIRGMSDTIKGNWLSFFSLSYSTTATWGSLASDYYILFPETTPKKQIFTLTFFGILLPTSFVGILGLLIGNVALSYKPWGEVYELNGMGGLLNEAFIPWGAGGKFLLMVIFLSLVSNNIINTYSAAFGVQLASVTFAKIPRWIWAIVLTVFYLICSLVGRNKLAAILGNFLPMVGYWISMYFIMLLEENLIFRRSRFLHLYTKEFPPDVERNTSPMRLLSSYESSNMQCYNFTVWNDHTKLTLGLASTSAFIVGVAGAAVGMAQVYWVGPLARMCGGEEGGDIAMWLCMGFSGSVFPILRYFELKKFGR